MPPQPSQPNQLRQGSIIWAKVKGADGATTRKPHAVVVLTSDAEIEAALEIAGVGVTSSPHPSEGLQWLVELPWHPNGHPATGFTRRSYAVCSWPVRIDVSDIDEVRWHIPERFVRAVLAKHDEFMESAGG